MSIFVAIILGIVQGITEFIPVSSSGHLILVGKVVDLGNHFTFDVLLNIGTLAALCWYTRAQIKSLVKDFIKGNLGLFYKLVVASMPAVVLGFVFSDFFEKLNTNTWVVVLMLAVVGIMMVIMRPGNRPFKKLSDISYSSALLIGLAQAVALVPGTSRSGITIVAAVFIGYSQKLSAQWSFLMAIPIVLGASLKTLLSSNGLEFVSNNFWAVFAGNLASFAVGLIAIDALFKIIKNKDLRIFGYYRIALSTLLAVLLLAGII